MKMPMDKGCSMDPTDKKAKMSVLGRLKDEASKAMGDRLRGMKKVTVASGDEAGLKQGLDKAKQLVSGDSAGQEMMDESPEGAEEMASMEEKSPEDMSPEELQAKIDELEALKKIKEAEMA